MSMIMYERNLSSKHKLLLSRLLIDTLTNPLIDCGHSSSLPSLPIYHSLMIDCGLPNRKEQKNRDNGKDEKEVSTKPDFVHFYRIRNPFHAMPICLTFQCLT
jgi:hypothetical protein